MLGYSSGLIQTLHAICLQYEKERHKHEHLVSDIFDSEAWKLRRRQIGAGPDDLVLMLLFCMDAIPAFKDKGKSLLLSESMIVNLPPKLRYKVQHMMLHFVMSASLKEREQKKYFDYMLNTELNALTTTGIPHPSGCSTIRVIIFGTPFDLPGRDKFFWLRGRRCLC